MLAMAAAGGLLLVFAVRQTDRRMRGELMQQAWLVGQSVDMAEVRSLAGSGDDLERPAYRRIKEQLVAARRADATYRFVYLLGRREGGELFIYVDSESPESADYLLPGAPYPEAAAGYHRAFAAGNATVIGPVTDRWGTWISALMPLVEPDNGSVVAVLGLDVDARKWRLAIAVRAAPVLGLAALLGIGFLAVLASRRRVEASARPLLQRLLPPLAAMLLLVFGLGGWLLLREHRRHLDGHFSRITERVDTGFHGLLEDARQRLENVARAMTHDPRLQQGFREGNPEQVLLAWRPVFEALRREIGITHCRLLNSDRTVRRWYLPAEGPAGGPVDAVTVLEAERAGRVATGLELSSNGIFGLHSVTPVAAAEGPLGFVDLGVGIGEVLARLQGRAGVHLALALHKEFLDRGEWEAGRRLLGREPDWDRLPHSVVAYASQGRLPDVFAPLADHDPHTGHGLGNGNREVGFGGKVWHVSAIPLRDVAGRNVGCLLAMADITEERNAFVRALTAGGVFGGILLAALLAFATILLRRTDAGIRAQQTELRDSANLLRTVMDHVPIGIAVNSVDPGVDFTYTNENFLAFYRVSREALASPDSFWEAVYEDAAFREELKQRVLADCRSGDPGRMHWEDIPITRQGKETTYICARNTQVPGSPLMVSTVWDVTGRKMAEEALREAERKYRLLVDHSQSIIYTIDLEGILTFVSPSWKDTLGHEPEEIVGRDFRPLVHEEDLAACEELLRRTAETGAVLPGVEYRVFHKDGSVRWHRSVITPVAAEGRSPTLFVGNAVDITARKTAEAEQERLRDQLMQSQKMESVGRLAGGVAHDFNNMLQAMLGYTEMVLDDAPPDAAFRRDLEEVQKIGRRAAELTRQLLAFARKQTVSPQVLDLNETVADMTGMLRRLIGEEISLAWLPGAALWSVKVDPTQIGMVLANLCVNARDAIQGTGRITIETRNVSIDEAYRARHVTAVAGDYVMLAVSDDGHGMDKATLAKVFEPFFTTKGVGKGTGLGLSTVHGIALQNSGFVNAYSEEGEGSTFRVYFPRYLGEEQARTTPESIEKEVRGGSETILVVEDETDILTVCGEVLGRLGYTVLLADTPGAALELAGKHEGPIDLLLTDVVMPEMDGRRLAERVGQFRPGIPCVYMSGYTANAIAHHGILDEGLAFLPKPFTNRELAEMVRGILDGGGV